MNIQKTEKGPTPRGTMGSGAWNKEGGGGLGTGKVNRAFRMASSDNELSWTVNRSVRDFTIREVSATNLPSETTGPKYV
jgi:hypothetical protein